MTVNKKPSNSDVLADAIIDLVWRVLRRGDAPVAKVYAAVFKNVNADDANLADITMVPNGAVVKGVPHMNADTFSVGDALLIITGPNIPYTILGKTVGDITLVT